MSPSSDRFSPAQISRLAALSRAYQDAVKDIHDAISQEMAKDFDPEWRVEVAERFGLTEREFARYVPEGVKRWRDGYIHRGGLIGPDQVVNLVKRDIAIGRLKPGDQLPGRTKFTEEYMCHKHTHAEVVAQLLAEGVIHRPGGNGGPLYVL